MQGQKFRIVFSGKISAGYSPNEVKGAIARLFGLDVGRAQHLVKLEKLFSGHPIVVKTGLTAELANKYQTAMAKVGAESLIQPVADPQSASAKAPPKAVERRKSQRRKRGDRRAMKRTSAILPDRRLSPGKRATDKKNASD